jgi:hypothetical protein
VGSPHTKRSVSYKCSQHVRAPHTGTSPPPPTGARVTKTSTTPAALPLRAGSGLGRLPYVIRDYNVIQAAYLVLPYYELSLPTMYCTRVDVRLEAAKGPSRANIS